MHETPLISTIVMGLVLAFLLGAIANRLRIPPLVGYLVAGILVGPHTPGFVADIGLATQLAEIGVILLMFGVGLHFSLKDLMEVGLLAVTGAFARIAIGTLLGLGVSTAMGWPLGGGLVFGLALSVASTVVLLKALQEHRLVETECGKLAIGWLIVEDLAMVLALVIIPALATIATGEVSDPPNPPAASLDQFFGTDLGIAGVLTLTLLKITAFLGLMVVVGRRIIPWSLHRIAHMGSRELFRLGVLAIALGVAFGAAQLFGVSLALGAFFAGMILSESELSQRAAQESLPLRDAFAVLFFVSVGMLFDPTILVRHPLPVLATLFIIVIGKSVAAFLIVLSFRKGVGAALTVSAGLAQIGEFSFIVAELAVRLKLLPPVGRNLILAGAILSIMLNPLVFYLCDRMKPWLEARLGRPASSGALFPGSRSPERDIAWPVASAGPSPPFSAALIDAPAQRPQADEDRASAAQPSHLTGHTVLVGFGRVGGLVGRQLFAAGVPLLIIETSSKRIVEAKNLGAEVIVGNGAQPAILWQANLPAAKTLFLAIPDTFEGGQIAEQARRANPTLFIIARAHSDAEVEHLTRLGADTVVMGEREIARAMIEWVRAPRPGAAA